MRGAPRQKRDRKQRTASITHTHQTVLAFNSAEKECSSSASGCGNESDEEDDCECDCDCDWLALADEAGVRTRLPSGAPAGAGKKTRSGVRIGLTEAVGTVGDGGLAAGCSPEPEADEERPGRPGELARLEHDG